MQIQQDKQFTHLLTTPMDRREFLIYAGSILLAITGIPALIKSITNSTPLKNLSKKQNEGFGSGPYGGLKK